MKITFKLGILFLAIASVACEKDTPEEKNPIPAFRSFKIVDGMIQSPKWLADKVEEVADRYGLTPLGKKTLSMGISGQL